MPPVEGTPPLSPILLLGLAVRPLPAPPLQALLRAVLRRLEARHADVFARLRPLAGTAFLIEPWDVPFKIVLRPGTQPPELQVLRQETPPPAVAAVIGGALTTLLALLQGRGDGDALFFSRDLVFEGDTEAVLTLRNAVDGADIDVFEDMISALGPLAATARRLAKPGRALAGRLQRDMERVQAALTAPIAGRCAAQAAELAILAEQVRVLRRRLAPRGTAAADMADRP
jgi:predicted lipid carrier protein YhbT